MIREPDEIDISILDRIAKHPGISISEVITPLLHLRSESVLRGRVRQLAILGQITMARTKHKILLHRKPGSEVKKDV
jgi:predicted transcriptional regulator